MIKVNMKTKGVKLCWEWGKETLQFENQVVSMANLLFMFICKQLILGRFHFQWGHRPELMSNCLYEELKFLIEDFIKALDYFYSTAFALDLKTDKRGVI